MLLKLKSFVSKSTLLITIIYIFLPITIKFYFSCHSNWWPHGPSVKMHVLPTGNQFAIIIVTIVSNVFSSKFMQTTFFYFFYTTYRQLFSFVPMKTILILSWYHAIENIQECIRMELQTITLDNMK